MKINNKKTKTALRIVLKIILCVVFLFTFNQVVELRENWRVQKKRKE